MKSAVQEHLPPNFGKLEKALRSIGYTFEAAVADIVDNSIDAEASQVLIRLIIRRDGLLDLLIWDNGKGMDKDTLKEAMRFGADVSQELERLGKFGLGLKLASLSQAKDLRVFSRKNGSLSGRGWLEEGITHGFFCSLFDAGECERIRAEFLPDLKLPQSYTFVWWSGLYRVGQNHHNPEEHAQKLIRRLGNHLALAFHRFLSGKARKVNIRVDIFDQKLGYPGIPINLDPLDPFNYPASGQKGFPITMFLDDGYRDRMSIKAHIWPPNSDLPGYKLPGGTNSRQGFYFYRHNRLIQGGGWNGMREAEPHASLARLEIDVAPEFDVDVSLDVKKVEIQLPPALISSIQKARSSSGIDLKKYLAIADQAYRTRPITVGELPLIPSEGLPAGLQNFLKDELRLETTKKFRDLKIEWGDLEEESFFAIDRDDGYLYLNQIYRRRLMHGLSGSSTDMPVVKCLLFFALKEAFLSERMSSKARDEIERINRILVAAVKYERSAR